MRAHTRPADTVTVGGAADAGPPGDDGSTAATRGDEDGRPGDGDRTPEAG
jgi:hypothetical protein